MVEIQIKLHFSCVYCLLCKRSHMGNSFAYQQSLVLCTLQIVSQKINNTINSINLPNTLTKTYSTTGLSNFGKFDVS